MNLFFILFIIGIIFFIMGYVNQITPSCDEKTEVKFVPRDVYDNMVMTNIL